MLANAGDKTLKPGAETVKQLSLIPCKPYVFSLWGQKVDRVGDGNGRHVFGTEAE